MESSPQPAGKTAQRKAPRKRAQYERRINFYSFLTALPDLLADQRVRAIEATALLRRVVEEIDAPLFAFDPDHVLKLINPAGERLLQQSSVRLIGRTAAEVGLAECLAAPNESLISL